MVYLNLSDCLLNSDSKIKQHAFVATRFHEMIYYTLSHPKNSCDVTERAQGYTLQDASFMHQSWWSFLNV